VSTSDAAGLALPAELPLDDELVDRLLGIREGQTFETKRAGENRRKIETVVAFANTEGGLLVLGIEDEEKATGRDRLYGVEENPEAVDELRHLLGHRVTPAVGPPVAEPVRFIPIGCTLRDGSRGSVVIVQVPKSAGVHSIVAGSTYIRYDKSNRPISASEIVELSMRRGTTSAVTALVDVPFDLLDTEHWRAYAAQRQLTRRVAEAMRHLGLAREEAGQLRPTCAAVLLFAEEPSGLLDSKCTIRVFHYKGEAVERSVHTNLVRPPRTVGGPLIRQIRAARDVIVDKLATGVQVGPLGFEIAQRYPVRVIQEAVTNAVIHRDYRLSADIHVRIFSNRIEIQSPGVLPGGSVSTPSAPSGRGRATACWSTTCASFPSRPTSTRGKACPDAAHDGGGVIVRADVLGRRRARGRHGAALQRGAAGGLDPAGGSPRVAQDHRECGDPRPPPHR